MNEIWSRFEALEECYEFMLAYAAQGLATHEGSAAGTQVREVLKRAVNAISGLAESCAAAIQNEPDRQRDAMLPFLAILDRDAHDSLITVKLVLAQPVISSQLIDNLNASMHLRALLTDIFLIGDVVKNRSRSLGAT
jgi:hypothetical protein